MSRDRPDGPSGDVPATWFVALPVAAPVRDALVPLVDAAAARDRAGAVGRTRPGGWHVTLAFLGRTGPDWAVRRRELVSALGPVVAAVPPARTPLVVGDVTVLGRAVAVEVGRTDWLVDLHAAVAAVVEPSRDPVGGPRRRLRPHVTVGRGRGRRDVTPFVAGLRRHLAATPVPSWSPTDMAVLGSHPAREGPAHYHPVATWPLPA